MSMRVHDLQHPYLNKHYRHKRAAGPDPVNIVLLACIFVLSSYFVYSVVTTSRYVPSFEDTRIVTQRGLTPFAVNVDHTRRDLSPAEVQSSGSQTTFTETQSKAWDEKPPYVRESIISSTMVGTRFMKTQAQEKNQHTGILR